MKNVLIDTDVILDFFFDREPFSENAAQVLSLCEKKIVIGFITPVILSNVYYLLSQKGKQEKVIEKLKSLISFLEILNIDKNAIITALNSDFKDFEDALQNYSAEQNGTINTIITRNTKDYKKSNLGVITPEEFLKTN
ncbi:type II toxin-antitoxin system VapC family toxin [Flavobacterium dankookense]|uniref:PIN domain-containing protein n=1 Tax=Flavobacterium dankookense TaxID=706186 RepID=A0A4R6QF11_9FLAO|nr:PIN domain-containing protein [Flavobacterium dankookense]TDP60847.1 PIN domain-containing protein [Flavobacterium dankookense]